MNGIETHPTDTARPDAGSGRSARRTGWLAAALALVVAVAVAAWALGARPGDRKEVVAASTGPTAERVAAAFVDAYASFDRPRLKALLADDPLSFWPTLRGYNLADEAIEFRILRGPCTVVDRLAVGTLVSCAFDVHALGSEQLGRGPYSDNTFEITVRGAEVVRSQMVFAYDSNGFAGEMWEPFTAWVTKHYPKDVPLMFVGDDARTDAVAAALFHRHIADYVAATSA